MVCVAHGGRQLKFTVQWLSRCRMTSIPGPPFFFFNFRCNNCVCVCVCARARVCVCVLRANLDNDDDYVSSDRVSRCVCVTYSVSACVHQGVCLCYMTPGGGGASDYIGPGKGGASDYIGPGSISKCNEAECTLARGGVKKGCTSISCNTFC